MPDINSNGNTLFEFPYAPANMNNFSLFLLIAIVRKEVLQNLLS